MNDDTHRWADEKLAGLDLRQKIGQLFVFGLNGPIETPDIIELIRDYHVGGLRIAQKFHGGSSGMSAPHSSVAAPPDVNTFDRPASLKDRPVHCTPWEYTCMLNRLRDHALERRGGVPLHFVFDQEGEGADLIFRAHLFPSAMGLARATPDGSLAYDVARAVSRQARAMGCNMIHSPVVDVNSTAENPEIGPRAYGEDAETVTMQALAALRGFSDGGIIATGKHFPGRGDSTEDAHFGLPVIDLEQEALMHNHLAPYRALIKAGLPAVMAGFTAYPSLDPSGVPAATSPLIIGELLRGELGFRGVVTTDNITMRGLLDFYDAEEAVIRSLLAGCDLILCRLQTPISKRLIQSVRVAIKDGRLSERRIDESVRRILAMRHAMGLHVDGGKVDPEQADLFEDTEICRTAIQAATRATEILRDSRGVLPLCRDAKGLLVEQCPATARSPASPESGCDDSLTSKAHAGSMRVPVASRRMVTRRPP